MNASRLILTYVLEPSASAVVRITGLAKRRRSTLGLLAAGLATSALPGSPAALPTPTGSASAPAIFGTVHLADGTPAAGAAIIATILPSLIDTDHAQGRVLGRTNTTPAGNFSLSIDTASDVIQAAEQNSGWLNIDVGAVLFHDSAALAGHWTTSLKLQPTDLGFAPLPQPLSISIANGASALNITKLGWNPFPDPQSSCDFYYFRQGNLQNVYTTVGELHGWDDMTMSFQDVRSSTTTVDTGASQDDSQSGWRINGTSSIGISDHIGVGIDSLPGPWMRQVQVNFAYEKDRRDLTCIPFGVVNTDYVTHADDQLDSLQWGASVDGVDGPDQYTQNADPLNSANLPAYGTFDKNNGKTQRYTAAASAFGFSFGTMTDYSQDFHYHWKMGNKYASDASSLTAPSNYHLWGENHTRPDLSQNVYAWSGITANLAQVCNGSAGTSKPDSAGNITFSVSFGCAYPIVQAGFVGGVQFYGDVCESGTSCPVGQPNTQWWWCNVAADGTSNHDRRCDSFPYLDGSTYNYSFSSTRNIATIAPEDYVSGTWWGTSANLSIVMNGPAGQLTYQLHVASYQDPYTTYIY